MILYPDFYPKKIEGEERSGDEISCEIGF